ncbi:transposase [Brucella anthropi]|uniref:transposase n=1 Tax=Brucella anthropi TaxID=529 RepID=UPI001F167A8F|nr:transposase [Brucella anthropi]
MEDTNLHCRTALPWPDRAMDRRCTDEQPHLRTWIETQLVPTLSAGDIVILDNVGFHKKPEG